MAQALGVRLIDGEGRPLDPGGAALLRLAGVDVSGLAPEVRSVAVVVASDVDNPLVGPEGASAVYGPQKGASPEDVFLLDRALRHYAAVLHRDLGIDVRDQAGAGAAGGLGAGLLAFLGARLRPGVEVVMEAVGLRPRIERADLVVTGEGRFDGQSLRGKTAAGVLAAAGEAGVPVTVVCGQAEEGVGHGVAIASLAGRFGMERAMEDTRRALEELTAELAATVEAPPGQEEVGSR
jgi:glycerate kinase